MTPNIQLGESYGVRLRGTQDDCLSHMKRMWDSLDGKYPEGVVVAMSGYGNGENSWDMHFGVRHPRSRRNRGDTTHRIKIRHEQILEKFPETRKYPTGRVEYRVDTRQWGGTAGTLHAWIKEIIPGRIDIDGPKGLIYP